MGAEVTGNVSVTLYRYVGDVNGEVDVFGLSIDRNIAPILETGNLKEGWIHIDARHLTGDHPKGAGDLFDAGVSRAGVESASAKILKKGKRVTVNPNSTMQVFEMKIRVKGSKKKELVRIALADLHTGGKSRLISAFPVRGGCHN